MVDVFLSGGYMMWPMLLCLIAVVVIAGRSAVGLLNDRQSPDEVGSAADAVLFWGGFSALLGVLGTLVGIAQAARAVARAGSVSTSLIWSGISLTLVTTLFGLAILLLAMLLWYGLRVATRRRRPPAAASAATLLALMAGALTGACGFSSPGPDAAVRTDSAGVQIVTSGAVDVPLGWTFERGWSVGDEGSGLLLGQLPPFRVGADAAGRVYVLDREAGEVVVLSAEGRVVERLGRSGDGPGELGTPIALSVDGDGAVAVFDYGKGGLVRWSADRTVQELTRIDAPFWGPKLEVTPAGVVFTALAERNGGTANQQLLRWSPDAATPLVRLTRAPDAAAEFPTCGIRGIPIGRMFEPELVWDAQGGLLAAAAGTEYVVDVFDGGRQVRSVRRAIAPRPADRAMALREAGDGMFIAVSNCTIPAEELVRGRGHADVLPAVRDVVVSPAGELWVERGRLMDEPAMIDVFSGDGAYLGTLPAGAPFPVAFTGSDRFVAIDRDAMGVFRLVEYTTTRS